MNFFVISQPRTILAGNMITKAFLLFPLLLGVAASEPEASTKIAVPEHVRLAVFLASNEAGKGTAFACVYRDKEFVATNLHVASGTSPLVIKTQSGDVIPLGKTVVLAEDADICLFSIAKPFLTYGITPLHFVSDGFKETKVGDRVYCLGNSLGNGVIIQADGEIKAFGNPRLETTAPFVGGNSGGPLIHADSGKVVGLVTETRENKDAESHTTRAERAIRSPDSELNEISYFAHRIDMVKKWSGSTVVQFLKTENALETHENSLTSMVRFLSDPTDETDWRNDRKLAEIWDTYSEFIDAANKKKTSRVELSSTGYRIRSTGISVAQSEYDKAYDRYIRGIENKIQDDVEGLKRLKSLGYIQAERRVRLENLSVKVKQYVNDFKQN
jgi:hypothetical protein